MIALENEANASVITSQVKAFSTGNNFARYQLYQKIAPGIKSILTNDDESGLGGLFRPFITPAK